MTDVHVETLVLVGLQVGAPEEIRAQRAAVVKRAHLRITHRVRLLGVCPQRVIPREIFQVVVVARDRLPDEHRRDAVRGAQRLDHQFIFAVGRDDARGLGRQRGRVVPHRHPVADSDGPDEARDRQLLDQRGEQALLFVGHFKCFDEPFPVRPACRPVG